MKGLNINELNIVKNDADVVQKDLHINKNGADAGQEILLSQVSKFVSELIKNNSDKIENIPVTLQIENIEITPEKICLNNTRLGLNIIIKK